MTQLSLTAPAPAPPPVPGPVLWIGLNPSTATATADDPTIAKEQRFVRSWGLPLDVPAIAYRESADQRRRWILTRPGMVMCNLFSARSTDPRGLLDLEAAHGTSFMDLMAIEDAAKIAGTVVCAWGGPYAPRALREVVAARADRVARRLQRIGRPLHVLALTKDGIPRHPLYLKGALRPVVWRTP